MELIYTRQRLQNAMNDAESYLSAIGLLSKSHDELLKIALGMASRQDFQYAFLLLEYMVEKGNKKSSFVLNHLGAVCINLQKMDRAIEVLKMSLVLSPNQAYTHMLLANVFANTHEYELAIGATSKGIELIEDDAPLMAFCYALRAFMYQATGNPDLFKIDMAKALEYAPDMDTENYSCKLCMNNDQE